MKHSYGYAKRYYNQQNIDVSLFCARTTQSLLGLWIIFTSVFSKHCKDVTWVFTSFFVLATGDYTLSSTLKLRLFRVEIVSIIQSKHAFRSISVILRGTWHTYSIIVHYDFIDYSHKIDPCYFAHSTPVLHVPYVK